MQAEYSALQENETWDLVPRPVDRPVIRCMWLFRHKFKSDGTLERYKARLVVNGKSQTVGIDCEDTFSPVVKPATIRTVLSLAVSKGWPIHQLDVKNAFLHGHLNETVFMHQPPGFIDKRFPGFVCRLKKSLYGLKQAPRAWYTRFANYILSHGFQSSACDNSLFIYSTGHEIAYLLLYVDDIVLTASSDKLLHDIIQTLSREFAMSDLGTLHHFLGIKVTHTATGLFLDQTQYAKDIINRANMTACKPCATPVDLSSKLSATDGPLFHDPTLYRSLAGALQYLTFTRPDISYAVQQVCLFMHEPHDPHYAFMKRIIRYIQGTLDYGIRMVKSATNSLVAYSDADWGGCPDSRRSTSGYCVFLGNNLISWSSKRQATVSRSSAEAEYRGVANAVAEVTWIRNLLLELRIPLIQASVVFCDNVSAVYLSDNPVQHQRTKHIEIDIHFVREKVRLGHVRVLHVPAPYQYADIFTKGLSRQLFQTFRSSLTVCPMTAQTAGEY
ncbi:putative RNA-directed DNA polymerase [Helianthus anomalus]